MLSAFWKSLVGAASFGTLLFLAFAFLSWADATRQQSEINKRLLQQMQTDALITGRALAYLEGRYPSLLERNVQLPSEDSGPRLVAPE
jgi:hypothetical protein